MSTSKKIDHLSFNVPNIDDAIAWYTENLGFKLIGDFEKNGFRIAYIDNGFVVYEFLENPSVKVPTVDHVAYKSEDIQADYAYNKAQGLEVGFISYIDFVWENGADYFFISAAGGEKIEFIQIR